MSTSTVCAYCRKPLLDRDHALAHGPTCEQNPTRAAARKAALLEIAALAQTEASGYGAWNAASVALESFAARLREIAGAP